MDRALLCKICFIKARTHSPILNEILITPLRTEVCFGPLIIHLQQTQMIAVHVIEIFPGCIGMNDFIFGTIKYRRIHREHSANCHNFFRAFVSVKIKDFKNDTLINNGRQQKTKPTSR